MEKFYLVLVRVNKDLSYQSPVYTLGLFHSEHKAKHFARNFNRRVQYQNKKSDGEYNKKRAEVKTEYVID